MRTNSEVFRKMADDMGMPLRTLEQVKEGLALAKENKADAAMARLMLRHGRLTDEARAFVAQKYPQ